MFVAYDKLTKLRVTSLDHEWSTRLMELREWVQSERLICPGCQQSLWLRTGELRRRHFAHRQLADCPLGSDSAEVMEIKAQLYEWLSSKYPGRVELDVDLQIEGWQKPADLVLAPAHGERFVYFVFDRQQRCRERLLQGSRNAEQSVHFIHTQTTHQQDPGANALKLSASQRDFICWSDYDRPTWPAEGHLYFIDGQRARLTIYRGLTCIHSPNLYSWTIRREDLLTEALISPKTGEILFAADIKTQKSWMAERDERNKSEADRKRQTSDAVAAERRSNNMQEDHTASRPEPPKVEMAPANLNGPYRCEDCGQETTDWSSATPSLQTCVCKSCSRNRWLAAQERSRT
jgi:hypothetical protein